MKQDWTTADLPLISKIKAWHDSLDIPVFVCEDNTWWFCDECGMDAYGPYETEEDAVKGCHDYAKTL